MKVKHELDVAGLSQAHGIPGCHVELLEQEGHYTGTMDKRNTCWCHPQILIQKDAQIFIHRQAS